MEGSVNRLRHGCDILELIIHCRIDISDRDGTLKIAEARASDAGEYTCEVSSDGGNDRRAANLDVIELPYAPTHVNAEKVSTAPKTVNVSWTAGFDGNNPIIKYILQYRYVPQKGPVPKDDLNWITAMANISASSRSILLSTLRSSAAYVFRVSAVNSVGEGPRSMPSNREDARLFCLTRRSKFTADTERKRTFKKKAAIAINPIKKWAGVGGFL